MPASESTLLLFATHLANSNISYATIKIYLSAVRHMHVTAQFLHPTANSMTPAGAERYPEEPNLNPLCNGSRMFISMNK